MKIVTFIMFAAAASATPPPPAPRQPPERIDASKRPPIELVTSSGASVLVESGDFGQTVEMYSPDRRSRRIVALDWRRTREVQTTVEKGSRVSIFYDTDDDGLPDIRRVYERRDGRLHLITSERLQWTTKPDEYDPRSK